MIYRERTVIVMLCFAMVYSSPAFLVGQELRFGNPAPGFTANLLQGNAFSNFPNGTICVVEFSGTACGPCIKLIPEMNALQKRYPDLIFVSVFCESVETVNRFMDGPGKAMEVRVAVDESGQMKREWLDAANLQSIPQVFIIDSSGTLAWYGYADEQTFGETLEKIALGTFDGRKEWMRMELTKKIEAEVRKLQEWVPKVNEVVKSAYACKSPGESIALLDKALPEFAGSPERITLLSEKLSFLATLPDSREQAYQHALALAVNAINERNPNHYLSACEAMLLHVDFARPENRDSRLAECHRHLFLPYCLEPMPIRKNFANGPIWILLESIAAGWSIKSLRSIF